MDAKRDEKFSKKETLRRVEAALLAALNTPPQPRKSMTPKRPKAQSVQKKKRGK